MSTETLLRGLKRLEARTLLHVVRRGRYREYRVCFAGRNWIELLVSNRAGRPVRLVINRKDPALTREANFVTAASSRPPKSLSFKRKRYRINSPRGGSFSMTASTATHRAKTSKPYLKGFGPIIKQLGQRGLLQRFNPWAWVNRHRQRYPLDFVRFLLRQLGRVRRAIRCVWAYLAGMIKKEWPKWQENPVRPPRTKEEEMIARLFDESRNSRRRSRLGLSRSFIRNQGGFWLNRPEIFKVLDSHIERLKERAEQMIKEGMSREGVVDICRIMYKKEVELLASLHPDVLRPNVSSEDAEEVLELPEGVPEFELPDRRPPRPLGLRPGPDDDWQMAAQNAARAAGVPDVPIPEPEPGRPTQQGLPPPVKSNPTETWRDVLKRLEEQSKARQID